MHLGKAVLSPQYNSRYKMDLEKFIERAAQSGQEDSKGSFTLGAEAARQKLLEYQQSAPERYLLMVVSAGIALGAWRVDIQWDRFQFEVNFPGALVEGEQFRDALGRVVRGEADAPLLDLMLGLYGALSAGAHRVYVLGGDPDLGYRWTLSPAGEEFESSGKARGGLSVRIERELKTAGKKIAQFVGKLRGFVGMCPECRLISKQCEYARIPISLNGALVNRPIFLSEALCSAQIGDVENVRETASRKLRLEGSNWSGALALNTRKLTLVIFGVSYPGPDDLDVSGVVFCDHLVRDISREKVVQDTRYQRLLTELQECKSQMVIEALKSWTVAKSCEKLLLVDKLADLMQRDRVSIPATLEILEHLQETSVDPDKKLTLCRFWALEARLLGKHSVAAVVGQYGFRFCLSEMKSEGSSVDLIQICLEMIEFTGDENRPYLEWLLWHCYRGVSEKAPGMDEWFPKANAEVVKRHGSGLNPKSQSLLLGLQACRTLWHSRMGFTHNAKLHLAYTKKMLQPPPIWTEEETGERLNGLADTLLRFSLGCPDIQAIYISELATQTAPQKPPPPENLEPGR